MRVVALIAALLLSSTPALGHSKGENNGWPDWDARRYGVKCDGVTDDHAALESALSSGEALIKLPAGATCVTSEDVALADGVRLEGSGTTIEAETGGTWTLGVLSGASTNQVELHEIDVDLNSQDTRGVYLATGAGAAELVVENVGVYGGPTTTLDLIQVDCTSGTGEWCVRAERLALECAASSAGGIDVTTTNGLATSIDSSTVDGCDGTGIDVGGENATVSANNVTADGASAHGIEISGRSRAIANDVRLTGTTAVEGITVTGTRSVVSANFVDCGVADGQCYRQESTYGTFTGNAHDCDGNDAIGYMMAGQYNQIAGATGFCGNGATGTRGLAHVVWSAQQVRLSSSTLIGGEWCARWEIDTPTINFRMSDTTCAFTEDGYVIAATGVHVGGSTMNWTSATEGVWMGNDGSLSTGDTTAACSTHSTFIGNNVQGLSLDSCFTGPADSSVTCSNILLSANECMNGTKLYAMDDACTISCPTLASQSITANLMMAAAEVVDISGTANITDIQIKGNANGDVDVKQVEGWNPTFGVWDDLKFMCGMWEPGGSDHVDGSFDLNPLIIGGTDYGLKPMFGICQCKRGAGGCATPPQIQLVKMECTGGGDATDGEACFGTAEDTCTGSCGVNVGTAFDCLDYDQETTDWTDLGDIWLDSEERLGWSVANSPGATDATGVWFCIYSL